MFKLVKNIFSAKLHIKQKHQFPPLCIYCVNNFIIITIFKKFYQFSYWLLDFFTLIFLNSSLIGIMFANFYSWYFFLWTFSWAMSIVAFYAQTFCTRKQHFLFPHFFNHIFYGFFFLNSFSKCISIISIHICKPHIMHNACAFLI